MKFLTTLVLALCAMLVLSCAPAASPAATSAPAAATSAATRAATSASATTSAATVAATTAATTAASAAEIKLTMICRCVIGGVSANTAQWLTTYVIPNFQNQMKQQGKNVTMTLTQFGGSDEEQKQRYALDLKAGKGEDVMDFDGFWVPEFAAGGLLKPIDTVYPDNKNWEGWQHISKATQSIMAYQGKNYGAPRGVDVRVIWYRKDIFKAAGLPDPWQPKSWDEMLDAARKIKAAKPDVTPIQLDAGTAMGEATTLQGYYMALLGTGSNPFNFDTSKYIVRGQPILDTLNFYKKIYLDEKLGDARLQLLKDGRDRTFVLFRDGQLAMYVEGDFLWRSVLASGANKLENRDQLVGWAKMPAQSPGKGYNKQDFVTVSGGGGYVVNPNSKNAAEAWAFIASAYSKTSLDEFQKIEPRIRSRDDVPVPNEPVMTALAKEVQPITTKRPEDAAYSTVVSPQIQLMTERVVSGEMTPQQAMDAFAKAVTDAVGATKVEDAK